jgi:hypothetical protein
MTPSGLAGTIAGDGVRAEGVAQRSAGLHREVALQVDAGVVQQLAADLDERAVLVGAQLDLSEDRVGGADGAALGDERRGAVRGGLGDLNGLAAGRVQHGGAGLHDRAVLDEVLDQAVVEVGRNRVAAGRRGAGRQRADLQLAPVHGALGADVEEPGAGLPAHPRAQLRTVAVAVTGALVTALRAALATRAALAPAAALLAVAVQVVERVVGVLGALLGVERGLDALVELAELVLEGVPLALLFGREVAVRLARGVRDRLHL